MQIFGPKLNKYEVKMAEALQVIYNIFTTLISGPVTVRTHTSQQVVNRASRFHRSAGLDELPQGQQQTGAGGRLGSSGRDSPGPSPSPSSSPGEISAIIP